MGTKLPRKLEQKLEITGEQIKLARLRRNLSIARVAEELLAPHLRFHVLRKGHRPSRLNKIFENQYITAENR